MSVLDITARELEPGDVLVADGAIDLRVTSVRPVAGFVVFAYDTPTLISGERTLAAGQAVTVRRNTGEACSALCAEMLGGHCGGEACIYRPTEVAA